MRFSAKTALGVFLPPSPPRAPVAGIRVKLVRRLGEILRLVQQIISRCAMKIKNKEQQKYYR